MFIVEKWKSLKHDLEQLNENYEKAEREKIDALTKLQVLSDYFKEKETQLQEWAYVLVFIVKFCDFLNF